MRSTRFLTMLIALTAAPPVVAQIPETFDNLKLLPADISRDRLVGTMRDWAGGLGVRCNHCHVGPDNLQGMDFATDEKATKRTARLMLEMSRSINRETLAAIPTREDGARPRVVSCYTCHRGQSVPPRNTVLLLGETALSEGLEAAFAELDRLRAEYSEAGVYDLGVDVLNSLAQRAVELGRTEDALAILDRNLELFPQAAGVLVRMAMTLATAGRTEEAKERIARALELDSSDPFARQVATRLGVEVPEV